jgi:hypothetical protein
VISIGKAEGRRPLGKPLTGNEDIVNSNFKDMVSENDWI